MEDWYWQQQYRNDDQKIQKPRLRELAWEPCRVIGFVNPSYSLIENLCTTHFQLRSTPNLHNSSVHWVSWSTISGTIENSFSAICENMFEIIESIPKIASILNASHKFEEEHLVCLPTILWKDKMCETQAASNLTTV